LPNVSGGFFTLRVASLQFIICPPGVWLFLQKTC
jgi:hypothetical protein